VAAERLHAMGAANVVVTGGHLEKAIDVLGFTTPAGAFEFRGVPVSTAGYDFRRTGTGCAFATAWLATWHRVGVCRRAFC